MKITRRLAAAAEVLKQNTLFYVQFFFIYNEGNIVN